MNLKVQNVEKVEKNKIKEPNANFRFYSMKSTINFIFKKKLFQYETNDDKILATCLSLCKNPIKEEPVKAGQFAFFLYFTVRRRSFKLQCKFP